MTDAQDTNDHDGPHEGPIKTPRQLILAVFFAFVVPIFGIVLLVVFVTSNSRPSAGSAVFSKESVAERLRPVGMVEVKDASDLASMKSGEQVFAAQCTACHTPGLLGAPKLGDAAAWAPRIKTGYDALLHSALAGKGQMAPQGGGDFTDFEIGRAVAYMANQSGGKLAEPTAPAAGASAPAGMTAAAGPAAATAGAASAPAGTITAASTVSTVPPPQTVAAAQPAAAAQASGPPPLYAQLCAACHVAGVAGAPKLGDKAAWAPRLAQGIDGLTASVVKGKGAMPPRGGSQASDADLRAVVTYMVDASK